MHGTLVFLPNPVRETEISEYLFSRNYEVSPQQVRTAWAFVSFIDYPRYGYKSWRSFFSRIFWRLHVKVDEDTVSNIARLVESRSYQLYSDAIDALVTVKQNDYRTSTVTTIAHFQFDPALQPVKECFDFVMTGYEAGCDKTNPRMYRKVLEVLQVKPEEAVMIGDDPPIDVVLPKKLGIHAILLNREGKSIDCTEADAVVSDLNEAVETVIRKFSHN
jgi:HAD superfamily hydrolase (TIGR01549 family)